MNLRHTIKAQARQALQGSWGTARGLLIIMLGLRVCINLADAAAAGLMGYRFEYVGSHAFSYSSNFFSDPAAILITVGLWVAELLLVSPLLVGMFHWYLELTDRRRQGALEIFSPYESRGWLRAALLEVNMMVRLGLFTILVFLPSVLLLQQSQQYRWADPLYMGLWLAGVLLLFPAGLLLWYFSKRYEMAAMLLSNRYGCTTRQAIRASVQFTKGHRWELMRLELSFLPWFLPTIAAALLFAWSANDYYSLLPMLFALLFCFLFIATAFKVQPYVMMSKTILLRYLYEAGQQKERDAAPYQSPEGELERDADPEPAAATVAWSNLDDACTPDAPPAPEPPATDGEVRWKDLE